MEQLNSVTLRGIIGSVKVHQVQDRKVAKISLATSYTYKTRSGECVVETTWHNVTAWSGAKTADLDTLEKGMTLEVEGRIHTNRYTASDGSERVLVEILAREVKVLEDHLTIENGR